MGEDVFFYFGLKKIGEVLNVQGCCQEKVSGLFDQLPVFHHQPKIGGGVHCGAGVQAPKFVDYFQKIKLVQVPHHALLPLRYVLLEQTQNLLLQDVVGRSELELEQGLQDSHFHQLLSLAFILHQDFNDLNYEEGVHPRGLLLEKIALGDNGALAVQVVPDAPDTQQMLEGPVLGVVDYLAQ